MFFSQNGSYRAITWAVQQRVWPFTIFPLNRIGGPSNNAGRPQFTGPEHLTRSRTVVFRVQRGLTRSTCIYSGKTFSLCKWSPDKTELVQETYNMTGQKFMDGKHWLFVRCAHFVGFTKPEEPHRKGFYFRPLHFMTNRIFATIDNP